MCVCVCVCDTHVCVRVRVCVAAAWCTCHSTHLALRGMSHTSFSPCWQIERVLECVYGNYKVPSKEKAAPNRRCPGDVASPVGLANIHQMHVNPSVD